MRYESELYHFGIKGMKWGVRRYQNKDGSLTSAGKKKYSKEYKKQVKKVTQDIRNNLGRLSDEANVEVAERFNREQERKYGKNYMDRDEYALEFDEAYINNYDKVFDRKLSDFIQSNENYRKSKELVDKYNMTAWDDIARDNEAFVEELRKRRG